MKQIATFFLTFSVQLFYIALVACPAMIYFQRKNRVHHKSALFSLYALLALSAITSVFRPNIAVITELSENIWMNIFSFTGLSSLIEWSFNAFHVELSQDSIYKTLLIAAVVFVGFGLSLYAMSLMAIAAKIKSLPVYRRFGNLTILMDKRDAIPHVFSLGRKSFVVIPKSALAERDFLRTAIQHEFEHIRNGDTSLIYLIQLLKSLFWIHPAMHSIVYYVKNLQEMRVDENLIHFKKIGYRKYLKTLNWFITCSGRRRALGFSYSIFGWSTFKELKKRVQVIHRVKPIKTQPLLFGALIVVNSFALILISNSSPRFNYSLKDIQNMYRPEYMKVEFTIEDHTNKNLSEVFKVKVPFGESTSLSMMNMGPGSPNYIGNFNIVDRYMPLTSEQKKRIGRFESLSVKVVEYSDDFVVAHFTKTFIRKNRPQDDDLSIDVEEETRKVAYDEEFVFEDLSGRYRIHKTFKAPEIAYFGKPTQYASR